MAQPATTTVDPVRNQLVRAFDGAARYDEPYTHWIVSDVFAGPVVDDLLNLPFTAPRLKVSGTREVNNDLRQYFDPPNIATFGVMAMVAHAFQHRDTVAAIERSFGAALARTYLRIEYALDTDGFWLTPHTDIGPKRFTMLIYVSRGPDRHPGTDVYYDATHHCKEVSHVSNTALVFVPSSSTWHGVERRPIAGVRRSIIVNYVSDDWRSTEQLSFPQTPVY